MSKIKRNYIYNTSYQILLIITPIITMPYISRVLGAVNIGIYEFTYSVLSYFILFGGLGINSYGQREIAYNQDNKQKKSRIFVELITLRAFSMGLSAVIFIIFALSSKEYKLYYLILSINIFNALFDISWFYQGIEFFKIIVIRNTIIRIINIICLFLFIKSADDLLLYFIYTSVFTLLGSLSLWFNIPKQIEKPSLIFKNFKEHLKGAAAMFIPQIAITVYFTLNRIMLGIITDSTENITFYAHAEKIVKIPLTFISSLSVVTIPRISNYFASNNYEMIKNTLNNSFRFTFMLAVPMVFGVIIIADGFVPWFFGAGFESIAPLVKIISPTIIIVGISWVLGQQYLIATKKQNYYNIAVICGAVINIILNLLLIPKIQAFGTAVATVITELTAMLVIVYFTRKVFNLKDIIVCSYKYFIGGAVMLVVIYPLGMLLKVSVISTMLQIIIGIIIYFGILLLLKDAFFINNVKQILNKLIKR